MSYLNPREKKIIHMRLGVGDYAMKYSLAAIGRTMDPPITGQRVMQLEIRAFKQLGVSKREMPNAGLYNRVRRYD